ncbi:MAG TPA: response regulator transcription factor [Firmicutes bacterium]|nr:response regulator transcription factor [Bacillota bacterium]
MRVLIVEDEPKIAAFIKQGLEEEGYAVDVAQDGESALDYAESAQYDLLILDIMLPKKDGISVCQELRKRGIKTPILMLTARDTIDDRVEGLDAGADDYLVKPFAFRELLARLRALLRRPREVTPARLQAEDLILDTATRRAERGGRVIDLTLREYALLELLMRHKGQVLSRTQIAEHVWNFDFYSESNIVDVYIRYLRQKIDADFQPKLIQTVRGVGYKIDDGEVKRLENRIEEKRIGEKR